jgi:glycosyltransferase involved in cell wall biosynthesis
MSISVCLCTYNGATHLGTQLESLAAQTRLPDEIIVGDDGSTDGTVEQLEQWAATAAMPVAIERHDARLGHVGNLESVLRRSSSDVILICDQDDRWHPEKIECLAVALEHAPAAGGAFADSALIDDLGQQVAGSLWQTLGFARVEQAAVGSGGGLGVVLRRNVVAGHALALRRDRLDTLLPFADLQHADWWLALGLLLTGGVVPVREQLVDYRLHPGNSVGLRSHVSVARRIVTTSATGRSRADAALLEALVQRIDRLHPGALGDEDRRLIQAKIAHSLLRGELPPRRRSRFLPVARATASGDYRRFSNGWRSALIDLAVARPRG